MYRNIYNSHDKRAACFSDEGLNVKNLNVAGKYAACFVHCSFSGDRMSFG